MTDGMPERRVAVECHCGWEHCDDYRLVDESEVRPGQKVLGPWRESDEGEAEFLLRQAKWKGRPRAFGSPTRRRTE